MIRALLLFLLCHYYIVFVSCTDNKSLMEWKNKLRSNEKKVSTELSSHNEGDTSTQNKSEYPKKGGATSSGLKQPMKPASHFVPSIHVRHDGKSNLEQSLAADTLPHPKRILNPEIKSTPDSGSAKKELISSSTGATTLKPDPKLRRSTSKDSKANLVPSITVESSSNPLLPKDSKFNQKSLAPKSNFDKQTPAAVSKKPNLVISLEHTSNTNSPSRSSPSRSSPLNMPSGGPSYNRFSSPKSSPTAKLDSPSKIDSPSKFRRGVSVRTSTSKLAKMTSLEKEELKDSLKSENIEAGINSDAECSTNKLPESQFLKEKIEGVSLKLGVKTTQKVGSLKNSPSKNLSPKNSPSKIVSPKNSPSKNVSPKNSPSKTVSPKNVCPINASTSKNVFSNKDETPRNSLSKKIESPKNLLSKKTESPKNLLSKKTESISDDAENLKKLEKKGKKIMNSTTKVHNWISSEIRSKSLSGKTAENRLKLNDIPSNKNASLESTNLIISLIDKEISKTLNSKAGRSVSGKDLSSINKPSLMPIANNNNENRPKLQKSSSLNADRAYTKNNWLIIPENSSKTQKAVNAEKQNEITVRKTADERKTTQNKRPLKLEKGNKAQKAKESNSQISILCFPCGSGKSSKNAKASEAPTSLGKSPSDRLKAKLSNVGKKKSRNEKTLAELLSESPDHETETRTRVIDNKGENSAMENQSKLLHYLENKLERTSSSDSHDVQSSSSCSSAEICSVMNPIARNCVMESCRVFVNHANEYKNGKSLIGPVSNELLISMIVPQLDNVLMGNCQVRKLPEFIGATVEVRPIIKVVNYETSVRYHRNDLGFVVCFYSKTKEEKTAIKFFVIPGVRKPSSFRDYFLAISSETDSNGASSSEIYLKVLTSIKISSSTTNTVNMKNILDHVPSLD